MHGDARRTHGDRAARHVALAALICVGAPGCYLSHELGDADASVDGGVDASHDAARPHDAHVGACDRLVAGPTVRLDEPGGVTPRLVGLADGDVGLAYVDPAAGDPTNVYYERLGYDLARLSGPVLVARDSWTWAEPARLGAGLVLAFGATASEPSVLVPLDLDGNVTGARVSVAVTHPEFLQPSSVGLFWVGVESHDTNRFVMVHVRPDGTQVHAPTTIELGRYGSGSGAAARPDGHGHVLAYPSEGPPGVREARVNAIAEDGSLAGERTLSTSGADAAVPVFVGGELRVVWRNDTELVVSTLDPVTLATISERRVPRLEGALFVADVEGRFVVGTAQPPALVALDLTGSAPARLEIPIPTPSTSGAITWTTVPGALVVGAGLVAGTRAIPWVARIECAEGVAPR